MEYLADIHNHTAKETLRWNIPLTVRHGETRDISPYLMFMFNEPVYYHHTASFPDSEERLGYWVGPAHNVGDALCHCILDAETHQYHETATVRPVTTKHPNFRLGVPSNVLPPKSKSTEPEDSPDDVPELHFDNVRIPIDIISSTNLDPELIYEPIDLSPIPETVKEKGGGHNKSKPSFQIKAKTQAGHHTP